ncbi:hypothetical protein P405_04125 [Streptomyces sp. FR-008]|nr:hypothetical protein P405_04125 [Streptomyces sp. FR-008]
MASSSSKAFGAPSYPMAGRSLMRMRSGRPAAEARELVVIRSPSGVVRSPTRVSASMMDRMRDRLDGSHIGRGRVALHRPGIGSGFFGSM